MSEENNGPSQPAMRSQAKKLFGRAFYESIGSPKYVLAPMVDQSEFAWRMLTRSFLPADSSSKLLAYSPMLHSRLFAEQHKYRNHHFEPLKTPIPTHSDPSINSKSQSSHDSDHKLDGNPAFDRPLFVQFCSNSPDNMLEAAKLVAPFCDAVDLNLGCPQGIARKGNYGAFLQEDWDLIYQLINKLHTELSIPVTAKMRILDTKERTLAYAKMILSAGASIITVHGRRREQKGHNTGLADWSMIRYLRDNLPPETVIFANGNILQHQDLDKCLAATGADGVMSAEANLNDPTVFAAPPPTGCESREYWQGRDGKGGYRMDAVLRRYLDIIYRYILEQDPPTRCPLFIPSDPTPDSTSDATLEPHDSTATHPDEPPSKKQKRAKKHKKDDLSVNLRVMQAHLFNLLRPLISKHTDIRDVLARTPSGDIEAYEQVLGMVERAVKQGLIEYENEAQEAQGESLPSSTSAEQADTTHEIPNATTAEDEPDPWLSSKAAIERCRRPWWICQPYIRPLPAEALEKGALQLSKKDKRKLAEDQETRRQNEDERDADGIVPNATAAGGAPSKPPGGEGQTDRSNVPLPQAGIVCG